MTSRIGIIGSKRRNAHPDISYVGGKAHGLFELRGMQNELNDLARYTFKGGASVPDFFIVPPEYDINDCSRMNQYARSLGSGPFAVRSSSPFEDSPLHPFDGIFDSYLGVVMDDLIDAIRCVRLSATGEKALNYAKSFGIEIDDRMPVIVQNMAEMDIRGVVYSRLPQRADICKVAYQYIDWKGNPLESIVDFICLGNYSKSRFLEKYQVIGSSEKIYNDSLVDVSSYVEKKMGHPVRIEYAIDTDRTGEKLYLLQARPFVCGNREKGAVLPDMSGYEMVTASEKSNNMICDMELPVLVACTGKTDSCLSYSEIKTLDKKMEDGYILLCDYLEFYSMGTEMNNCTPNKKGVVSLSDLGLHHDLDIARGNGFPYMCSTNLMPILGTGKYGDSQIKTGDILRMVSDGVMSYIFMPQ